MIALQTDPFFDGSQMPVSPVDLDLGYLEIQLTLFLLFFNTSSVREFIIAVPPTQMPKFKVFMDKQIKQARPKFPEVRCPQIPLLFALAGLTWLAGVGRSWPPSNLYETGYSPLSACMSFCNFHCNLPFPVAMCRGENMCCAGRLAGLGVAVKGLGSYHAELCC